MSFYLQPDHESIATHIFFEVHDDGRISILDDLSEGGQLGDVEKLMSNKMRLN